MARARSEKRRQEIIAAASTVFENLGYERASMAAISAIAGGSKATLYGYFRSKEELFYAVMTQTLEGPRGKIGETLDEANPNLREVLENFARSYLSFVTSPEAISLIRTTISEGRGSRQSGLLYNLGPRKGWTLVEGFMARKMSQGVLRNVSATMAAHHLRGLLGAGTVDPLTYGADPIFTISEAVTGAVDAFMRAYATQLEDE